MDRRSHGVYGYGIEKSTSQMQLSSRDDDERVQVKDVMAGSGWNSRSTLDRYYERE